MLQHRQTLYEADIWAHASHITTYWSTHSETDSLLWKGSNLQPAMYKSEAVAGKQAMHRGTIVHKFSHYRVNLQTHQWNKTLTYISIVTMPRNITEYHTVNFPCPHLSWQSFWWEMMKKWRKEWFADKVSPWALCAPVATCKRKRKTEKASCVLPLERSFTDTPLGWDTQHQADLCLGLHLWDCIQLL